MNILYIGPNYSEWGQENSPCSLAASKWSRGFLLALSRLVNVTALTHDYYFPWPKGNKMWSGCDERLHPVEWACEVVPYPVFRYVREWWWRFAYAARAKKIISEKQIDVVLIYNCHESWQVPVLRSIKTAFPNVKIIPIILDGNDPRKDDWRWMKRAATYSDAFIALSWWVCQHIPEKTGRPSYHFDGGADAWRGEEIPRKCKRGFARLSNGELYTSSLDNEYKLVHTGALDQWRGLDFMIDVVKKMTDKRKDIKFIFCGKSSVKVLQNVFGSNPSVELPGFVKEEEMRKICNSADVLLNVRTPTHPDNILNYPSKLPHYLSFGRPVVSTRLQSLSPDYAEVVHYPADDTVEAYIATVNDVLDWDENAKKKEYVKIKEWFGKHKTWDVIVKSLVYWIKEMAK